MAQRHSQPVAAHDSPAGGVALCRQHGATRKCGARRPESVLGVRNPGAVIVAVHPEPCLGGRHGGKPGVVVVKVLAVLLVPALFFFLNRRSAVFLAGVTAPPAIVYGSLLLKRIAIWIPLTEQATDRTAGRPAFLSPALFTSLEPQSHPWRLTWLQMHH